MLPPPKHQMKPRSAYPPFPRWSYPVTQWRVIDGDTVEVYVQKWTDEVKHFNVRVTGIDTPEKDVLREKPAALVAKTALEHWIAQFGPLDRLQCEVLEEDKYGGRMIGDFFDRAHPNAMRVSQWMLHTGFAKTYSGETKLPWTDQELADILARGQVNFPTTKLPHKRPHMVAGFRPLRRR